MKCLEIALAAVGGAVVGAAAAVLLAPQSGARTRAQIRRFIREKFPNACDCHVEAMAEDIENRMNGPMGERVEPGKA